MCIHVVCQFSFFTDVYLVVIEIVVFNIYFSIFLLTFIYSGSANFLLSVSVRERGRERESKSFC